jgi:phage shock protein A
LAEQEESLQADIARYEEQASTACADGHDARAQRRIEQKQRTKRALEDIQTQIQDLHEMEADLQDRIIDLTAKKYDFKTEKETLEARYRKAEAVDTVKSNLLGLSPSGQLLEQEQAALQAVESQSTNR